ncbi:M14 family zinc carboxypeptidase [Halobacteria archaeon AArc-dxtr1]|nr:M14 family zinc carboxypeptidase [Halobacteria archaeon AArc-dxtr1]
MNVKFETYDENGTPPSEYDSYGMFRLDGVAGQTVNFVWDNVDDIRDDRVPSDYNLLWTTDVDDPDSWQRFEDSPPIWSKSFGPDENTVYVLIWPSLNYQNTVDYAQKLDEHDEVTLDVIGQSQEGRDVYRMAISDPEVPDSDKLKFPIFSRIHPGESLISYTFEGMVDYILDVFQDPDIEFEEDYNFLCYPHLHPDGMYHGWDRYDADERDFNRVWEEETPPAPIDDIRSDIEDMPGEPDWLVDLHCATHTDQDAALYHPDAPNADEMDIIEAVADKSLSMSDTKAWDTEGGTTTWWYEKHGRPGVLSETWTYYDYELDELREEGENFMKELTTTVDS